jgi:CheY-like chemotaxis protein
METASKQSHANEPRRALSGKKLLCIDDHADTLMMMRVLLESHGAELLTAESIDRAMELLGKGAIHLIVCDMIMPDGGALVILEALNKVGRLIPVVALTGLSEDQCGTDIGRFAAYLMKPVDEPVLVGTISSLLNGAARIRRAA